MTLSEFLKGIADAIRNKKGTTEKIKATDFANEISTISGGENLDDVLNEQENIINNQGTNITDIENALQNVGKNTFNVTIDGNLLEINTTTSNSSYMLNRMITEINVDWTGIGTNWTSTAYMFYTNINLKKIDVNGLNTSKVKDMRYMFAGQGNSGGLEEINLNTLDTSNVTNVNYMFAGHTRLNKIYMKNFNPEKISSYSYMLSYVPTTCEITTNQTMATWLNDKYPDYTNIKIVKADWEV